MDRLTVVVDIPLAMRSPEQILRTIAFDIQEGKTTGQGAGYEWRIEGVSYD